MKRQTRFTPNGKRRFPAGKLLCGLLAASSLTFSAQAARTVPVQVDGRPLDAVCYLESGVTYVPLRTLLDTLGGWDVHWDREQKAAVASSTASHLKADPTEGTVTVDGKTRSGNVYVEKGKTYVPLRLTAELLGGSAEWDSYFHGAAMTSAAADYNAVELYWLSRIISAESRGEPLEGQIAVGNVVLGRVASQEFPNTIPAVIFDRQSGIAQFEPTENGTVYFDPAPQSVAAAKRVLDGEKSLEGALFFYAPALSQGVWINDNRTYLTTIGCHRFYL